MARALIAVGAALVLALLVLGTVIYVNRDEDGIAVDNLLAEDITRAIGTAEDRGADVDLGQDRELRVGRAGDRPARRHDARSSRASSGARGRASSSSAPATS